MTRAEVGLTVTHRRYVPYCHAHYAGNLVDGAYSLAAVRRRRHRGVHPHRRRRGAVRVVLRRRSSSRRCGPATSSRSRRGWCGSEPAPARWSSRCASSAGAPRSAARPPPTCSTRRWWRPPPVGSWWCPRAGVTYRWRVPTPLRYAARPAAAVAAGLCLWLAFPEADLWWLAPVGVALLGAATADRRCAARVRCSGCSPGWPSSCPCCRGPASTSARCPGSRWPPSRRSTSPPCRPWSATPVGGSPPPGTRRGLPASCRWPGWCRSGLRGATPYGGFPWAGWRSARPTARWPTSPRWLGAPGVTFAVAVVGTLLARRGRPPPCTASWVRAARRPRSSPVALVALAPLAIPLPTDGRAGVRRLRAGQRAAGRAGLQRRAPGRARQPRRRHRAARRAAPPRRPQPSWSGRRTPPTSTRSATPTPPPQIDRARTRSGCRCSSVRCSPSRRRLQLERHRCSTSPGRPSRSATSSGTRCRSPSTSRAAPSSGIFTADGRPRAATSSRAPRSASSGCRPPAGTTSRCRRSASRWPTTA